jgi:hypothetical protein
MRELVRLERHHQIRDTAASLAISHPEDDRGAGLADLAGLLLAGWNRSNAGTLISFARVISVTHPIFWSGSGRAFPAPIREVMGRCISGAAGVAFSRRTPSAREGSA